MTDVFSTLSHSHALYLSPDGIAHTSACLQGMHAITSVLLEDTLFADTTGLKDVRNPNGDPALARIDRSDLTLGLYYALSCCTALLERILDGQSPHALALPATHPELHQLHDLAHALHAHVRPHT